MQVLRKHRKAVFFAALLAIIIAVSFFISQNVSKPSPTPTSSPSTTATVSPTLTPPFPTSTPTASFTLTPAPTISIPTATPIILYPGEVTQYQGQSLSAISDVYENAIAGTQSIDQTSYRLTVTGLVNNTLKYTYGGVVSNHQKYQKVVTIYCVEGWNAKILWEGILVNDLLQEAGVNPKATVVIFHASDGYTTALPLEYIVQNNIILAYKMNNVTLTPYTGWPFMLVSESQYGYKWIKWLTEIEVSDNTGYLGYWESRGYPNNAAVP